MADFADLIKVPLDAVRYPNGCIGFEVMFPKHDEPFRHIIAQMYVGPPISKRAHRWAEVVHISRLPSLIYQCELNNDPSRWRDD